MKKETELLLWALKSVLDEERNKMDAYMYRGEEPLPSGDLAYCRKVYDSICKTLDLL